MQLIEANWLLVVLALLIGLLVAWFIFSANRRTKVTIESRADDGEPARRNQAFIDSAPVAVSADLAPEPAASDLARIKGVGPKLITQLQELGVTSVAQVAAWDAAEIARIDSQLGRFAGRIQRDDWVGQAQLLQTGDRSAFEERFGKL